MHTSSFQAIRFRGAVRGGAMILVPLIWALAIVSPQHFFPIASLYQELAVAAAVLVSTLVLALLPQDGANISLPWAAWPFLGMMPVLLLNLPLGRAPYPDALVWPLGSLLVAALAAVVAARCKARGQVDVLMRYWAGAFALAALGTAVVMWWQLLHPEQIAWWLFPRSALQAPFGNLAQRNQAALVLGFGLLAAGYFAQPTPAYRSLRALVAGLLSLLLISAIALSQSRIGLAFLVVAGPCAGLMFARRRTWAAALLGLASALVAYALLQWLIYDAMGLGQLFPPGLQRLADRGAGQRVALWDVAWQAFRAHPWLGAGWGNFAAWNYRLALEHAQPLFATNAHNLLAQLAAESGLLGLAVVLVPAGISLVVAVRAWWQSADRPVRPWALVALGVCAMVLGYSMTEYPLWYLLYSVPFGVCWGALDAPAWVFRANAGLRAAVVSVALLSLLVCGWAAQRYALIAQTFAAVFFPGTDPRAHDAAGKLLQSVLPSPGFSPYTDALVFTRLGTDAFMLPDKIQLGQRVVGTMLGAEMIAKLAVLDGLAGQATNSAQNFARVCAFFPAECINASNNLRNLEKTDPKAFRPVATEFFSMPQSRMRASKLNVLRPWDRHSEGVVVTIDPHKTLFGIDLALYASGLAQMGWKSGTFLAGSRNDRPADASPSSSVAPKPPTPSQGAAR